MTGFNMPPGVNESDIPGYRPEDLAFDEFQNWIDERAADIAHKASPRCTGGAGYGPGGDGLRWHSKGCLDLREILSEAMGEVAEKLWLGEQT